MAKDEEIFESLIAGGLIGAALGALLTSNRNGNGAGIGALAGAVLLATLKANERAQKSSVSVLIEEDNIIYEVNSKGEKKFVREIPKSEKTLPEKYKLK